jgi:hypothetical protein
MKYIVLTLVLLLSACMSVPVERRFPTVPAEIQTPCGNLQTIDPATTRLSVVLDSVVVNYGQYQECQAKTDSWIEWYTKQKQLFESVK